MLNFFRWCVFGYTIHLFQLRSFSKPFKVRMQKIKEGPKVAYLACIDSIAEFGLGKTEDEALEDLEAQVMRLYIYLVIMENNLGKDLTRVLEILRKHKVKK